MRLYDVRLASSISLIAVIALGACNDSGTDVDAVNVTTTSLPGASPGLMYSEALAAEGGDGSTYAWTLATASGPLPAGLDLAADGTLSGIPTATGTFPFTVEVSSGGDTDQQALTVVVAVDCYIASCAGLVGMWRLDESPLADSTDVFDGSALGHAGQLLTEDGTTDKSAAGQVDGAVDLDFVDDYIEIEDAPELDLVAAFTLMAWVNLDAVDVGYQAIISKSSAPVRPASLWVLDDRVEVWFTPPGLAASSTSTITAGAWHHIAATFSNAANEIRIYIDGVLSDTVTGVTANPDTNDLPLVLGQRGDGNFYVDGRIDGVMVWNRVLTALEIDAIYDYAP
jgi:hypothetical protein